MGNGGSKAASAPSFYDFGLKDIRGTSDISMRQFLGKVVLVVNVASKCGFTESNYQQLVDLADRYQPRGLEVVLCPCNQFGKQEPGTPQDVCHFIQAYSNKFHITEKIDVNGQGTHALFAFLKQQCPGTLTNAIKWNFTKFLIDRQGKPIKRYAPTEEPKSFTEDILQLLQQPVVTTSDSKDNDQSLKSQKK